eukprot:gnl/TRDRNA2_/TRDRNA2_77057_c1_seq1.p1 gnl/TRDRNA2_/TRDRNA2_77057_c1~~gnl/TRDRNA2_/TRDRNA2_77057_c1_seq1.p1  ORF type:complete len:134 (-),score=48.48 gnl/TRDRNA2_/TRDRNA2_77057_c1_seq1:430-831(-)
MYYSPLSKPYGHTFDLPPDAGEAELKKFLKKEAKLPCSVDTMERCGKKDKQFIMDVASWKASRVKEEYANMVSKLKSTKQAALDKRDELQAALPKAQRAEEASQEANATLRKLNKNKLYKLKILEAMLAKQEL